MIMDDMAKRRKRKEEAQRELMQRGLKLDYSNLPSDVKAAITATTSMPYIVEETVKLTILPQYHLIKHTYLYVYIHNII